jgi:murein DD-endopeptidase MepM/ murein hydrolase activator NlpD/predicted chitinase
MITEDTKTKPVAPATPITKPIAPAAQEPPKQSYPTPEDVKKVLPQFDLDSIKKNLPYILRAMNEAGLKSKNQLVGIIATMGTETLNFTPASEIGPGSSSVEGGSRYRGRGYIQLTHTSNYESFGALLKLPLVDNPELAGQPEIAAKITVMYWQGKHNQDQNCQISAEAQDWHEVRRKIQGNPNGHDNDFGRTFKPAIDRGMEIFKSGIDGMPALPGNTGATDFDTGGAPAVTMVGQHNPTSQLGAMEAALGLMALDSHKTHIAQFYLDLHGQPDILKLDAGLTFEARGLGEGLDDTYTVEEVLFLFGDRLEAEVTAFKPDPNAKIQMFRGDASKPDAPQKHQPAPESAVAQTVTVSGMPVSKQGWRSPMPIEGNTVAGMRCEWGSARGRHHAGIDYGGYGSGSDPDAIYAAKSGKVKIAKSDPSGGEGRMIRLDHGDNTESVYMHIQAPLLVSEGQSVQAGQKIAMRGCSGFGADCGYGQKNIHLHFGVYINGQDVNPRDVLPHPQIKMV